MKQTIIERDLAIVGYVYISWPRLELKHAAAESVCNIMGSRSNLTVHCIGRVISGETKAHGAGQDK